MSRTYHVTVGSFEGPFDLLLQLIARHKVDIYDIPLAEITDDYLAVLRDMGVRADGEDTPGEAFDLDVATEFLVVAATLVELKAARLLPGEDDPELEELALEARDLLYARLLDYRVFKEAAGFLRERLAAHAGYVPRGVAMEARFAGITPEVQLPVSAAELAELAARAFAEQPDPTVDTSHLQPVHMTVRQAAGLLADELARAGGQASFAELTAGCRHRVEVLVCFLAVLELFKLEHVDVEQATNFGELRVRWIDPAPDPSTALAAMDDLGEVGP